MRNSKENKAIGFAKKVAIVLTFFTISQATTFNVKTIAELQTAVNNGHAGDKILLADGTYLNASLTLKTAGVTVAAEHPGKVFLNGTTSVNISGDGITFSGFQFTSGSITGNIVEINGNHDTISQCNFNGFSAKKYISVSENSQYADISFCTIENKPETAPSGCTVQIGVSATQPGLHTIRWCEFKNFDGAGGDFGNEPIRIGLSTQSFVSRTVVEHCYFTKVGKGDSESISLKSDENVVRFCTFDNNPDGMLVFRNGNRNIAYGNYFVNGSGGIRLKETNDNFIYNNYFERSGATGSTNAISFLYVAPNLKNINFIHNTFVDCGEIDLGGTGPTAVTFANNIFKKSTGTHFSNDNGASIFAGNLYTGTLGIAIPFGMKEIEPLLGKNGGGLYVLTAKSPAIDAGSSAYPPILDIESISDDPQLLTDFDGTVRPTVATQKDVGCDEYSATGKSNLLKEFDGGPEYLKQVVSIGTTSQRDNNPSLVRVSHNQLTFSETLAGQTKTVTLFGLNGKVLFEQSRTGSNFVLPESISKGVNVCAVRINGVTVFCSKLVR